MTPRLWRYDATAQLEDEKTVNQQDKTADLLADMDREQRKRSRNEAAERHANDFLNELSMRMGWGKADPRFAQTERDFRKALAAERAAGYAEGSRVMVPQDELGYLHDGQWFRVDPAAERRATVERIRATIMGPQGNQIRSTSAYIGLLAILDEEAAR